MLLPPNDKANRHGRKDVLLIKIALPAVSGSATCYAAARAPRVLTGYRTDGWRENWSDLLAAITQDHAMTHPAVSVSRNQHGNLIAVVGPIFFQSLHGHFWKHAAKV